MNEDLIGTFIVKEPKTGTHLEAGLGYKIGYVMSIDERPETLGKPCTLDDSFIPRRLHMTEMEYHNKLKNFGAELKLIITITERNRSGELGKKYTMTNPFFKNKEDAKKAADWANSQLTLLKLMGKEYHNDIREYIK